MQRLVRSGVVCRNDHRVISANLLLSWLYIFFVTGRTKSETATFLLFVSFKKINPWWTLPRVAFRMVIVWMSVENNVTLKYGLKTLTELYLQQ